MKVTGGGRRKEGRRKEATTATRNNKGKNGNPAFSPHIVHLCYFSREEGGKEEGADDENDGICQ